MKIKIKLSNPIKVFKWVFQGDYTPLYPGLAIIFVIFLYYLVKFLTEVAI